MHLGCKVYVNTGSEEGQRSDDDTQLVHLQNQAAMASPIVFFKGVWVVRVIILSKQLTKCLHLPNGVKGQWYAIYHHTSRSLCDCWKMFLDNPISTLFEAD